MVGNGAVSIGYLNFLLFYGTDSRIVYAKLTFYGEKAILLYKQMG